MFFFPIKQLKNTDGIAHCVIPDQTALKEQSDQGHTVCPVLLVPIFQNLTVFSVIQNR